MKFDWPVQRWVLVWGAVCLGETERAPLGSGQPETSTTVDCSPSQITPRTWQMSKQSTYNIHYFNIHVHYLQYSQDQMLYISWHFSTQWSRVVWYDITISNLGFLTHFLQFGPSILGHWDFCIGKFLIKYLFHESIHIKDPSLVIYNHVTYFLMGRDSGSVALAGEDLGSTWRSNDQKHITHWTHMELYLVLHNNILDEDTATSCFTH